MKYRANHQQNQHNLELHKIYLDNLLEIEKEQQIIHNHQQLNTNASKVNVKSNTLNSINTTNSTTATPAAMKHKQNLQLNNNINNTQISGLNNLGNSCFFNAILQNLAQTPHLEELLRENSTTQERLYVIKHNDDYDSELTDHDDDEEHSSSSKSISSETKTEDSLKETISEVEVVTKSGDEDNKQLHRSMRLNELSILLKEQSGANGSFLGKQLADLLKNMNNTNSTVNPSALFGSVCKKLPAFKGFQQQDSHELLRNLLDAIKTEELKRRQSALLETFRASKPISLDDKIKMKIKRYGRLASYTHIDKLFGGHLLSSIVCEECSTCIQRVEPFLDLSLPISTPSTSQEDLTADCGRKKFTRSNSSNNKKTKSNLEKMNEDIKQQTDNKQTLSKHLTKKQQKKAAKTAKKLRKQSSQKESETNEDLDNGDSEAQNQVASTSDSADLITSVNKLNLEEENINCDEEENIEDNPIVENLNDVQEDDLCTDEKIPDEDDLKYKLENSFKLEAMKTIKCLENDSNSTLESCLWKFTSNETLSDKIKCENCTKKSRSSTNVYARAIKQYLICELPAILTIHLKRFQQHGYRLEKSNKHVQFPLILDMSAYTSKMCMNINRNQRNQSDSVLYSLYGLVEHSGRLNSGHYTAYVKSNRDKLHLKSSLFLGNQRLCHLNKMLRKWNGHSLVDTNNNSLDKEISEKRFHEINGAAAIDQDQGEVTSSEEKWFYISDSHVTEVNVSKVLKAQAYILFYERIE